MWIWTYFRRVSRYVLCLSLLFVVSSFAPPGCCFECVHYVLKHGNCSSPDMVIKSHRRFFIWLFCFFFFIANCTGYHGSFDHVAVTFSAVDARYAFSSLFPILHTTQHVWLKRVELSWKYTRCRVITNNMAFFSTANRADSVQRTRQIQHKQDGRPSIFTMIDSV